MKPRYRAPFFASENSNLPLEWKENRGGLRHTGANNSFRGVCVLCWMNPRIFHKSNTLPKKIDEGARREQKDHVIRFIAT